jgi:hypothetical protein
VSFRALRNRFHTTCSTRTGSASTITGVSVPRVNQGESTSLIQIVAPYLGPLQRQRDALGRGLFLHRLGHGAHGGGPVHGRTVQRQLAGVQPREVQQVLDDLRLAAHRALDGLGHAHHHGHRARLGQAQQQLGAELDQVQRVLELVREHGQELVLELAGRQRVCMPCGRALQQRLTLGLGVLAAGEVTRDLAVAAQPAALVQRRGRAAAPEAAPILAQVPTFVLAAARVARVPALELGLTARTVLGREDHVQSRRCATGRAASSASARSRATSPIASATRRRCAAVRSSSGC